MKKRILRAVRSVALGGVLVVCLPFSVMAQVHYEYDALGRLVKVERSSSGKTVTYSYDAAGNRQSVSQALTLVEFSVSGASVSEGGRLGFVIAKSGSTSQTHAVSYASADGTAGAGDYAAVSDVASFGPGETTKTVYVQTTQDSVYEAGETVFLTLSNPTNGAGLGSAQAVGTILNDDAAPSFAINDVTRAEGENLVFTVTRSGATAFSHSVNYATADNTAAAPSDYVAKSGTLSFTPSQSSRTITITGVEDTIREDTKDFRVSLSNATNNATISDGEGVGTITNDDPNSPPVAVTDSAGAEFQQWVIVWAVANDTDPDGDWITIQSVSAPSGVDYQIINNNTRVRLRGGSGDHVVSYTITDGHGGTDTGVINFSVDPVEPCPEC